MRHGSLTNRLIFAFGMASLAPLFATATTAADEVTAKKPGALRVISYNVQFLPGPGRIANKRPKLEYRAEQLGNIEVAIFTSQTLNSAPRMIE